VGAALLQGKGRGLRRVVALRPSLRGETPLPSWLERRTWQRLTSGRQNWHSARTHSLRRSWRVRHRWAYEEGLQLVVLVQVCNPRGGPALCRPERDIRAGHALNLVLGRGCWVGVPPLILANGQSRPA